MSDSVRHLRDDVSDEDPWPDKWIVGPGQPDNVHLGKLLEDLRLNAGLSRSDAAVQLGISTEYLRLLEVGKRAPALGQMRNVLDVYGADGEVEQITYDGYRRDLIVRDPLTGDPHVAKFTSRIREARRKALDGPPDADEPSPDGGRAAEIGRVVLLLSRADDGTLRKVRAMLEDAT
ncbi:helix-turn-helix transcriptional regulator [Patulibacter sp.]|uniref:helix-turn-helix transcriptional regulator n=1 Tax=Patulibacter sp. TaxID=1912859 RepID=UPI002720C24D|nr:helix-turn-helix transcriptional regulator [Patulibacter sp.]MDO9410083.1 helix-turn-helix transcriptional regulator [Patulibacter sp.]